MVSVSCAPPMIRTPVGSSARISPAHRVGARPRTRSDPAAGRGRNPVNVHRWSGSHHRRSVHLAQRIRDQFQPLAVGTPEIDRRAVDVGVLDAEIVEPRLEPVPLLGLDRDRQVMQPAEHLLVRADVETGEVEERQRVVVADVEEEVGRARDSPGSRTARSAGTPRPPGRSGSSARRCSTAARRGARLGPSTTAARAVTQVARPQCIPFRFAIGLAPMGHVVRRSLGSVIASLLWSRSALRHRRLRRPASCHRRPSQPHGVARLEPAVVSSCALPRATKTWPNAASGTATRSPGCSRAPHSTASRWRIEMAASWPCPDAIGTRPPRAS